LKVSPGKGLGLFATRDIAAGREILRERPLLGAIHADNDSLFLEALIKTLPKEDKNNFLALVGRNLCSCKNTPCFETIVRKIFEANDFSKVTSAKARA
jgi:hypothetical protein